MDMAYGSIQLANDVKFRFCTDQKPNEGLESRVSGNRQGRKGNRELQKNRLSFILGNDAFPFSGSLLWFGWIFLKVNG